MMVSVEMLVVLIQMACVIVVVAQVVTASPVLRAAVFQQGNWKNILLITILFGLLSIYGTYSGFDVLGAKVNIRDLGPMIAGLIAGPFAGIGAGLIGGVHRFMIGGVSAVPCSIATILSGILSGLIYLKCSHRFCGVKIAVLFAILMECLHMLLMVLLVQPYSVAIEMVSTVAIPMILANALGMGAFSIIITDYLKRQKMEPDAEKREQNSPE